MTKRSPLALAVLALLEEAPMHPYRIQQLIALRGKDKVINVSQRASLYSTVDRLARDGLIRVLETERDGQRPERSIYEISDAGRVTARGWLREMLSVPKNGFPDFHAALAHAPMLEPAELAALLRTRCDTVACEVAELEKELELASAYLPRVVLLDAELIARTRSIELGFLRDALAGLDSGGMTWTRQSLAALALRQDAPSQDSVSQDAKH
ncbi:PadR family transcriptional regulator [Arthrobacter sp. H35-D1]|uniref:PadR family transcriptional regulator n=1 Tax=Arthrobacter sp. H35-D1 TaxID=3046202 RepID=UPI0024BB3607|nr:PadR family transcriptional regulator [Arthrobacter sp. H35-D1]MDJ0312857.1 PadR family transcriptional regulator [Arthrobacter sp. H35-D1]